MGESKENSSSESRPAEGEKGGTGLGPRAPRRWRRLFVKLAIVGGVFLVLAAAGIGGAEYYTGRPEFCDSCHIMDPYYNSWEKDVHHTKLGVRCVDCHYAPGERHTFKAKFKGLSQATSYFSGRAGGGRPRAHVNDLSCLTSGCHGDGKYLEKSNLIGEPRTEKRLVGDQEIEVKRFPTVTFVHRVHLQVKDKLTQSDQRIAEIQQRLKGSVPVDVDEPLRLAVTSASPVSEREASVRAILAKSGIRNVERDTMELLQLEDVRTRLEQVIGLTCAACHTYDASGKAHFAVDRETCYTCHFANQSFNEGTGACLKCHQPPTRQVFVHGTPGVPGQKPAIMNHQEILQRGINCAGCHLDVVQGQAVVTVRECAHCHDRETYLEGFEKRTTRKVEEYHRVHVAAQRARCVDCHRAIRHGLVDPMHVATSADYLKPVLDDCRYCHSHHHQEQVELLMGVGGEGISRPMPNAMFGSRLNCRACHTNPGSDFKGAPLVKATQATCIACHGEDYESLYQQWVNEMAASLKEATHALARMDQRVKELKAQGRTIPDQVTELIAQAQHNVNLVQAGNGVHNKNYALQLLDYGERALEQAAAILESH